MLRRSSAISPRTHEAAPSSAHRSVTTSSWWLPKSLAPMVSSTMSARRTAVRWSEPGCLSCASSPALSWPPWPRFCTVTLAPRALLSARA